MKPETLRGLHAEWRKLSPSLGSELPEREARLAWTNEKLQWAPGKGPVITSWSGLTEGQARRLLKIMREESGDGPEYRATLIATLACEFFGAEWDRYLREDLIKRFHTSYPQSLTPAEAHAEIEELVSRIARRVGVEIEEVRARFRRAGASPGQAERSPTRTA
jgi:hypothetical protein